MSRLNEKDLAILRARGINGFTTLRDDEVAEYVKPDEPTKAAKPKKIKAAKPKNNHPLIGKILHTSWGYDMTINDFCKIIEVSPTGKTVKCRMISRKVSGDPWSPGSTGKAAAGETEYGPVFRLKVGETCGHPSFHGSYPYCFRDEEKEWKAYMGRKGYFTICSKNEEFYENRCD